MNIEIIHGSQNNFLHRVFVKTNKKITAYYMNFISFLTEHWLIILEKIHRLEITTKTRQTAYKTNQGHVLRILVCFLECSITNYFYIHYTDFPGEHYDSKFIDPYVIIIIKRSAACAHALSHHQYMPPGNH